MGLIKVIKNIGIILAIFIFPLSATASWLGPNEIVKGGWGNSMEEFGYQTGEPNDKYPKNFIILSDNKIIVEDWINDRIVLYSSKGKFLKSIYHPGYGLYGQGSDKIVSFNWNDQVKSNNIGLYNLKTEKWEWVDTKNNFRYINSLDLLVTKDGIFFWYDKTGYYYSFMGQLLKTYDTMPLELGRVQERSVSSGKIETTIEFPDHTYKVNTAIGKHSRDIIWNFYDVLYAAKTFENEVEPIICYTVIQVDRCTGEEYVFEPPRSQYAGYSPEEINSPAPRREIKIEYGEPIVSPLGDLYCWARTKTHYKILKWTWQGPEDAPQSVQISSGVAGLKLNWQKPVKEIETITGYQILRSTEVCGPFNEVIILKKDKLVFEDMTIRPPWKYYYVVKAVRDKKFSGDSNKVYMQWK